MFFSVVLFNVWMLQEACTSNVQLYVILRVVLQIRDYRKDWDLEVNEPIAGNYYPVSFALSIFI